MRRPAGADRIPALRTKTEALLQPQFVHPEIAEVVLVEETLSQTEAEGGEQNLSRVVTEAGPAQMGDAVVLAVNMEAVEVGIAPAEGELPRGMQVGTAAARCGQASVARPGG